MEALLLAALNALWQGAALIAVVTLALRAHGVTAPFVARLKAPGSANLSAADLIRLRDAGI
jgi:hypothetical protein